MTGIEIMAEIPVLWDGHLRGELATEPQPGKVLIPPIGVDVRVGTGPFAVEVGYRQSASFFDIGPGVGGSTGFLHGDLVVRTRLPEKVGGYFLFAGGLGLGYADLRGFTPRFAVGANTAIEGGVAFETGRRWRVGLRADSNITTSYWELWSEYPEGRMTWTWATANPGIRLVVGFALPQR